MKRNRITIIGIFLLLFWAGFNVYRFFTGDWFGAGSYPYAETFHLNASEGEVIAVIRTLQKEGCLHTPPGKTNNISVRDTTAPYPDFWRHIRLYYPDTNEQVYTWTRPFDSTSTTFAFYQLNDKVINQDFWYITNAIEKRKFRKRVFEPLEAKVAEMKRKNIKVKKKNQD